MPLMKKNLLRTMARLPLDPQRSRADPLSTAVARGLLSLLDTYGSRDFEEALVEALERDRIHVAAVRHVLERNRAAQSLPPRTDLRIAPAKHADLVVTPHNLGSYDGLSKKENTDDHS